MIVRMNGVVIKRDLPTNSLTPLDLQKQIEETYTMINQKTREVRRSKAVKHIIGLLAFISTLGATTMAHAFDGNDNQDYTTNFDNQYGTSIVAKLATHIGKNAIKNGIGIKEDNTLVGHMDEWIKDVLLHTTDMFGDPSIKHMFNLIWGICLSFTTLIISKKGYDMVKAKMLGVSTIGGAELVIRLLGSLVMTFLSLDIVHLGISASNLVVDTFFKAIESHIIPYSALEHSTMGGAVFWMIGYMLLFVVLSVQYWVRQITIVLVGCLLPVANLSWVTDGGRMLGTLTRELITLLATPLTHGLILGITGAIVMEVDLHSANAFMNGLNKLLIGLSSMFMMIITPTILRKFVSNSANPVKWAWNVGVGIKGNAVRTLRLIK